MSISDEELHKKLEAQERINEQKWIEKNRPTLGKYTIPWDGLVRWFVGLGDRLLWSWFEEDIKHSQQWEKKMRYKKQQEEQQSQSTNQVNSQTKNPDA